MDKEKIMCMFVDCVKTALATGQGHLVNCKKFEDFINALPESEDRGWHVDVNLPCPACKQKLTIPIDKNMFPPPETDTEIAKRMIDEFWYEKYSDVPLDGMFRKFIDWLEGKE